MALYLGDYELAISALTESHGNFRWRMTGLGADEELHDRAALACIERGIARAKELAAARP